MVVVNRVLRPETVDSSCLWDIADSGEDDCLGLVGEEDLVTRQTQFYSYPESILPHQVEQDLDIPRLEPDIHLRLLPVDEDIVVDHMLVVAAAVQQWDYILHTRVVHTVLPGHNLLEVVVIVVVVHSQPGDHVEVEVFLLVQHLRLVQMNKRLLHTLSSSSFLLFQHLHHSLDLAEPLDSTLSFVKCFVETDGER